VKVAANTALFADLERLVVTDPPAAVSLARDSMDDIDASGPIEQRVRLRRMLAMAYGHTSQFEQALAACEEAIALPGPVDGPVEIAIEIARTQLASMQPLANLDRIDDAIRAGQVALKTLEARESVSLAGRAALNLGSINAMTGRHDMALRNFDRARTYLADEPVVLGQIETNRGTALAALDRFTDAEAAFERASALLDTGEMSWAVAIAEGNLADLAARQGAINRSLRQFELSRRHLERDGALGDLGRLNTEEAIVLAKAGLTALARDAFEVALGLLDEHGTPGDLVMAQIAYGGLLVDEGELAEANTVLGRTELLIDAEEQAGLYQQYRALKARLAVATGHYDEAHELIDTVTRELDDRPVQRARWSMLEADLAHARGDLAFSRAILERALTVAETAQITPLIAELHQALANIVRESGDHHQANAHARMAIASFERIRGTIQADRLRQSWHHGRLDVYVDFYRSLLAAGGQEAQAEAFGVAERIRSRMLLDAINARSADVEIVGPVSEVERPLVEELAGHRRWLNWMYSLLGDGVELAELLQVELRNREKAAAQLADRLATLRPSRGFDEPVAIERVQESLGESTVILSYLAAGGRLTLQVINGDRIESVSDLGAMTNVANLIGSLQFQIGRALVHGDNAIPPARLARLRRDTDAILECLYDVLVAPVSTWLDSNQRIIVIPTGDLHSVPFAALRHDGTYLVDRHAVVTAPGVSVVLGMRGNGQHPEHPLVAGVADEYAPGLDDEAAFVATRFPDATLLLNDAATRDALLAGMPGAGLIHLACHGRFDAAHPAASGLLCADGWLTLDRLAELRLDRPLVVLTGCETGRVRVDRGDDLVGMMTALIAAGASGLITSLWKTHDAAATASMAAFYDALAGGADPVTALRHSQCTVRQHFDHPAWWAPFVGVYAREKGNSR
jgi:tetratricopeptide (TPR) repeat protein